MGNNRDDAVLRAKYLDWCSARIADRFLALSPDEIYERAEKATLGQPAQASPQASLSASSHGAEPDWRAAVGNAVATVSDNDSDEASAFKALVARVTEVLADEMELPTFEEWSAAYSEAPEEFDADLVGFWKESE